MKHLFVFLSFAMTLSCGAQPPGNYSSKNKKAIKLFELGRNAPNESIDPRTNGPNFRKGIEYMNQAIDKDPDFWEAHMFAGEFCEYIRDFQQAIEHYKSALRIHPEHSRTGSTHFYLANLQFQEGEYSDAIANLDIFVRNRNANPELIAAANQIRANCEFAMEAVKHPYSFNPINVGPGVNTADPEYFPTITVDGKTILFTRLIKDGRVQGPIPKQEDFFVSELSNSNIWGKAVPMPDNVNTVNNEGAPTLGADGRSLVFVACPDATGRNYGEDREGRGSCDLFYTKKLGSRWTTPVNLPGMVNSFHWESQPSLSADGKTLYFIRGIRGDGGENDADIYVTHLREDGTWGTPERLPDYINTPQKEESVLIHPDGKTLYFASAGHTGMGGLDLYMCRLEENEKWGKPINLGYPINTSYDENSLMVSPDGEIAFFASDREGGYGDLDIYYFVMPEHLRPTKTLHFEGIVYDKDTKIPLPGKFQLIDLETGKEVVYAEADRVTGEFMVPLPLNREYALNVSYPGYTFFSKNFNMRAEREDQEAVIMDVPMIPLKADSIPVPLENVFFDLGRATLRPESKVELDKMVDFLEENPSICIELHGHTDTRGDDEKNMILSQNRAKSVYQYLIDHGIKKERLAHRGFGETKPKISDEKMNAMASEKEKEAAHQTNRRTEYIITKR